MSTFYDPKANFIVRDVPKGGSTTLRGWYAQYLFGKPPTLSRTKMKDYYVNSGIGHLMQNGYKVDLYSPFEGESIAIKRDPVSRFLSCYMDKVVSEGFLNGCSVDELLDNWESLIVNDDNRDGWKQPYNIVWFHFTPQTTFLGTDKTEYDRVFDIKDLGTSLKEYLEDRWSIKLPELHCRNTSSMKKVELTTKQTDKIMAIYNEDYVAGWC